MQAHHKGRGIPQIGRKIAPVPCKTNPQYIKGTTVHLTTNSPWLRQFSIRGMLHWGLRCDGDDGENLELCKEYPSHPRCLWKIRRDTMKLPGAPKQRALLHAPWLPWFPGSFHSLPTYCSGTACPLRTTLSRSCPNRAWLNSQRRRRGQFTSKNSHARLPQKCRRERGIRGEKKLTWKRNRNIR